MSQNISSAGCFNASASFSVGTSNETLSGRSYLLSIPSNYSLDTPAPLILSFHGGGQSPSTQLDLDQLTNSDVNEKYIVIYPEAIDEQWQVAPNSTTDDIGFVTDILDDIESTLCIDISQIYATGKSQGGGMAGLLACDETLSTRFAAFAPVSGAFYIEDADDCKPASVKISCSAGRANIPMLEFHGGDDPVVPYDGDDSKRDACLPAIPHWVQDWAERNDLGTSNTSTSITKSAKLYQFGNDSNLGLVSHVYDGSSIGHVWPTKKLFADDSDSATASFDATPMILEFFGNYTLDIDSKNTSSGGDGNGTDTSGTDDDDSSASGRKATAIWWLIGFTIFQSLII
ncbi:carbohydrate esterase family 1 protein [Pestalotiopsis sp. NC0098]|nr:carbohydrate esterase family 1 protein [Pestalotiopsis sp. NC0098]